MRGRRQAEAGRGGAAPPWGTVLPVPEGAPRRGEGRTVPTAEEFLFGPTLQRAEARKAFITSLGVFHPKHFRGRSFRYRSIRRSSALPMRANDERLG